MMFTTMASRSILPNFKNLFRSNKQCEQLKSIHVTRLSLYCSNYSAVGNVKTKCLMTFPSSALLIPFNLNHLIMRRWKFGKNQKSDKYDTDDEDENNYENPDVQSIISHNRNAKILNSTLNSMRIDALIKVGFGLARNKADVALYEGKFRVNEKKPLKKGLQIKIDDVIDFIHGPSPKNPDFIVVTRITVLDASVQENLYKVQLLREKSLTIENYDDSRYINKDDS